MLTEQARQYICTLSDADLIEYIQVGTEMYEPDAVAYAREERDRRSLAPDRVAGLEAQADAQIATRIATRDAQLAEMASRPLGTIGRTLAFIGGFVMAWVPLCIAWAWLHYRGERTKVRDMWAWAASAFVNMVVTLCIWGVIAFMLK